MNTGWIPWAVISASVLIFAYVGLCNRGDDIVCQPQPRDVPPTCHRIYP